MKCPKKVINVPTAHENRVMQEWKIFETEISYEMETMKLKIVTKEKIRGIRREIEVLSEIEKT